MRVDDSLLLSYNVCIMKRSGDQQLTKLVITLPLPLCG